MPNNTSLEPAPPRDSVWTKYSPNHEFPLAGVTSFVLHGLVIAGVLLFGLALQVRWHGEATKSPKLDVALVQAAEGDGSTSGGSPAPGTPGQPVERVEPVAPSKSPFELTATPNLDAFPSPNLESKIDVPVIPSTSPATDLKNAFANINKNLKASAEPKSNQTPKGSGAGGGQGGGGKGTGKGSGEGPGNSVGGYPSSSTAPRAAILAARWRFDPQGSPRDHVNKLMAAGIIVGFQDQAGSFSLIHDLKQRPVTYHREPMDNYKDTVKWFSQNPSMVVAVARELQITKIQPLHFVLLLPKDREQKFADVELKFAQDRNRDMQHVKATWFDFRPVGGSFEPVVLGQVPFEFPDVAGK